MGKRILEGLTFLFNCLLDVIMPKPLICTYCGRVLKEYSSTYLCGTCLSQIKRFEEQAIACENIVESLNKQHGSIKLAFDGAFSACIYEGLVKEMVHRFKYNDKRSIALTIAAMINELIRENNVKYDLIVPVPISKKRYRKRGYNHTELIARELSNITGVKYINAIKRIKDTSPQVLLNEDERWYNVKDAFECGIDLRNKSILLIDDVITTGATAHYCSVELKSSGASNVVVLSFARSNLL
jgi:competence protein ComFC